MPVRPLSSPFHQSELTVPIVSARATATLRGRGRPRDVPCSVTVTTSPVLRGKSSASLPL